MIIPGNAWLALLSPPQEFQGAREEEGGFGALLTEIEQHTAALPDQEEPERGALECVLHVLMSIFQSWPAAHPLPVVPTLGTEESSLGRAELAGGLLLGLPPDGGSTPALWHTEEVNLLPGMVAIRAQDIAPLAFPASEGQSTGPSPVTTGVPENFPWLFHQQESTQGLSEFFKAQPKAVWSTAFPAAELDAPSGALLPTPSVSRASVLATAESPFVSPELQQPCLASGGESPATTGLRQPGPSQSPESPPTVPVLAPAVAAKTGDTPVIMALVRENIALPEYDASPAPRQRPESREWVAETLPSVAPLTTDSALPLASPRTTSHLPSPAPAIAVLTHRSLEDLERPWSLPMSANTVVLHLEPRELGALLLRVRVNDKRLIASFQTQSPEAEILLRSHLPSLHESLSQHGFEVQPIAITRAAEGCSVHMGAGTGAFAHQHSAFQGFAEDWQATHASENQDEVDLQRAPRWSAEQRPRLLDVVI